MLTSAIRIEAFTERDVRALARRAMVLLCHAAALSREYRCPRLDDGSCLQQTELDAGGLEAVRRVEVRPASSGRRSLRHVLFFNATAPPEIYTLSLHDALPI